MKPNGRLPTWWRLRRIVGDRYPDQLRSSTSYLASGTEWLPRCVWCQARGLRLRRAVVLVQTSPQSPLFLKRIGKSFTFISDCRRFCGCQNFQEPHSSTAFNEQADRFNINQLQTANYRRIQRGLESGSGPGSSQPCNAQKRRMTGDPGRRDNGRE